MTISSEMWFAFSVKFGWLCIIYMLYVFSQFPHFRIIVCFRWGLWQFRLTFGITSVLVCTIILMQSSCHDEKMLNNLWNNQVFNNRWLILPRTAILIWTICFTFTGAIVYSVYFLVFQLSYKNHKIKYKQYSPNSPIQLSNFLPNTFYCIMLTPFPYNLELFSLKKYSLPEYFEIWKNVNLDNLPRCILLAIFLKHKLMIARNSWPIQ